MWKKPPKSWPAFHHQINQVYHAIIAVSLVPFALVFLGLDSGKYTSSPITDSYHWILLIALIPLAAVPCWYVWKQLSLKVRTVDKGLSIAQQLQFYFRLQVKRYLLLELSGLISLLGLWLTLNYLFVITYLVVLVQFSLLRPSQDKVIRDLQFTKEDREELRKDQL